MDQITQVNGHPATELEEFMDAEAAVARVQEIYSDSLQIIRDRFAAFAAGDRQSDMPDGAYYPYVGIDVGSENVNHDTKASYGNLPAPGRYGVTLTRPDLFRSYYLEQFKLLIKNHDRPLIIGRSLRKIPLSFAVETADTGIDVTDMRDIQRIFPLPDLGRIDDKVANGLLSGELGSEDIHPMALFSAERVDYSLVRLAHYTATSPEYFQRYVLFTNYQRYVDEFIAYSLDQVKNGSEYRAFVSPGDVYVPNPHLTDRPESGEAPAHLPQMPAYHLIGKAHSGITLVNIGVGPSNAKTITDHIAVTRPHCWLMVGHCGGLRRTQRLGDYVLAHAYVRADHVLDEDLPAWVPVPPIAEVQVAMTEAVGKITGLKGRDMKTRLRTGTVFTTDDRDWELRRDDLARQFNQTRAIAVDMESATIAANGYRFRVPYGTLLCVSDKPLHGEIKLRGMANAFYRERISQHLKVGIATLQKLRQDGALHLHSRKLRSFDEPPFR